MSNNKIALFTACLISASLITQALAAPALDSSNCGGMYSYTNGAAGKRAVTADFGPRTPPKTATGQGSSWHQGYDIGMGASNKTGDTNAYSTLGGKVVQVGAIGRYGNVVIIENSAGVRTTYAHVPDGQTKVAVGQQVSAGQVIANYTGQSTGNTGGAHIHYETSVLYDGRWINVDPSVVENRVAQGLCPDSPAFANSVVHETLGKHKLTSATSLQSKAHGGTLDPKQDVCNADTSAHTADDGHDH